jgi:hypothetical protein
LPRAESGTRRLFAARVVAAVGALFWGWLFFGVQDTLTVFVEGQDFAAHYLMESGWGLLFLVLVAGPLIGLVFRPGTVVLVAQVVAVGVAVVVGALMAGSPAHLLPAAALVLTALAVATLGRCRVRSVRFRVDRPLAVLALVAAGPALAYAWRMATSDVDVERTVNLDHYPIQASLGISALLIASLIAVTKECSTSWLATATLTVTVGWLGIESAVYPHELGSFGALWGWLAFAWAVVFLLLALRPRARSQPT